MQIKIFDTTLRDGEQAPGCSMNITEKIQLARQLERLGVDVIEAGFAAASKGDFESVKLIADELQNTVVTSLARSVKEDIDKAYEALKNAKHSRIHIFLATSDIHLKYKLELTKDEAYDQAVKAVKYAKNLFEDIEFSCEDATRTDPQFMYRILEGVIEAGATTVNIPDTVGYITPFEYYDLIKGVMENTKGIEKVTVSVHCHDDLGLAVANSLAAIRAGATQVECTVNGIGERAGNAAMEEVVMALKTRADEYGADTNINTKEIAKTSKLLTHITGVKVAPNKAVVGKNAFAHEAGIHQHGVMKNRATYEIMTPESVGFSKTELVLGKHSGKHALAQKFAELGYEINDKELQTLFEKFKNLADLKKEIYDEDLEALLIGGYAEIEGGYKFVDYTAFTSNGKQAKTVIKLEYQGEEIEEVGSGDGPIDAAFDCVGKIAKEHVKLKSFTIEAVTQGKDAIGLTHVVLKKDDREVQGRGASTDIIKSSILAYINGINRFKMGGVREE